MVEHDEIIAYHEAGHAVVARVLDMTVVHVTMEPIDGNCGHVEFLRPSVALRLAGNTDPQARLGALRRECKQALAGPHADLRRQPEISRMKELTEAAGANFGDDVEKAKRFVVEMVELLKTGMCSDDAETQVPIADVAECMPLYVQLCHETKELVAENWPAIERVAESLQRLRTLTQIEVDELIAD